MLKLGVSDFKIFTRLWNFILWPKFLFSSLLIRLDNVLCVYRPFVFSLLDNVFSIILPLIQLNVCLVLTDLWEFLIYFGHYSCDNYAYYCAYCCNFFFFFFFWLFLWHANGKCSRAGIKPVPQLWAEPQQWQSQILNLLCYWVILWLKKTFLVWKYWAL